jgi:hypothetical protein
MAGKKSGGRAGTGAGAKTLKRGARKAGLKLKDLDAKMDRKIRGGALQAYVHLPGQKSGDIKGP